MAIYFQGAWEHWLFFRGAREQAHNFGDIGSLPKSKKIKEKPPFCLIFFKISSASGGGLATQTPLVNSKSSTFHTNMLIKI